MPAHKDFEGKETVKWQGGDSINEGSPDPSDNSQCIEEPPDRGSWGVKTTPQTPFLNLAPFQHWHGVKNIARVRIIGESCKAPLDNGAQINTIMPKYVSDHSLQMGPITNLIGAKLTCMGLGNAYMRPLGYVLIWVQVDRVQGYDKYQIVLVILDLSNFAVWIPVTLGTPTISRVINVMKEAEIDALAMPLADARVALLLSVCRMMTVEVGGNIAKESSPDSYDQVMFTPHIGTIEAFSSHMVLVKAGGPTLENVLISWYKLYGPKTALCSRASQYRTHAQRWGEEGKRQS